MSTDDFTTAARVRANGQWPMQEERHAFVTGAVWARDHLAAQEPTNADRRFGPRATAVIREWTGVYPGEDREPSDAEVEAAAIQLCASAHHELVWEALAKVDPKRQEHFRSMARAALSAARNARRDEKGKP